MEIMLVLPISAAQWEHAVSAQNRIKSNLCVGLHSSTLQDLIRITAEGPPVSEFNATPAADKCLARDWNAGQRQWRPQLKTSFAVNICNIEASAQFCRVLRTQTEEKVKKP